MARQTDVAHDDGSASVTRIDTSAYETAAHDTVVHDGVAARIVIPDTELLFSARFKKVGGDLVLTGENGNKFVVEGYFNQAKRLDLAAPGGAFLSGELVERLAIPENPGQYAQVGAPAGAAVIGRVERLGGSATVQHANGVVEELNIGDSIRQGDVIETRTGSTLGISFVDGTAFNMGASARMLISELVYDAAGASNSAVFSLVKGAISFVAGQAAKTGDMRVETPIASVGIRGTAVNTNITTDVNGQAVSVTYSLMQDPDGSIGAFNIVDPTTGAIIATVTTTDNVFTLTPTAAGINALTSPKTAQDIAQELAIAQALFPVFLGNPANFQSQPTQPDQQPRAPSPPGSSSPPPGGSTPSPDNPPPSPEQHGANEPNNDPPTSNPVDGGTTPSVDIPLPTHTPPLVVVTGNPAHLVEAVQSGDAGVATSVAQIFKYDLEGGVTIDTAGWQAVGNGIYVMQGIYGVAALNKDGAGAQELIGAGWISVGNGVFEKQIGSSVVRVTAAIDTVTYALDNVRADGLGPQDHPTETFGVTVVDSDGMRSSTTVVFTVDGRNDPPDLGPEAGPHDAEESPNATGGVGTLELGGTLAFTDPELGQTHQVDPVLADAVWSGASVGHAIPAQAQAAFAQALQAFLVADNKGSGTGQITWEFALPDHLVDFLREGETLTLTYNVVRDSLNATSSQPVTIVITGTNDQPVVTSGVGTFEAVGEQPGTSGSDTPDSLSGTFTFTDVDLNDAHVATASLVPDGLAWSRNAEIPFESFLAITIAMTATIVADSTHTGTGSLIWNFDLADRYLDFLAAGETLELTYVVGVADDSGASNSTTTQEVKIIITGTNDVPVISVAEPEVSLAPDTTIDITGVHVSDPDLSDTLTVVLQVGNGTISLGATGDLPVSIEYLDDGSIAITGSAAVVDAVIAAGVHYTPTVHFTGEDSLTIQVWDGNDPNGDPVTQSVAINVGETSPETNAATASIDEGAASPVEIKLTGSDADGSVVAFKIVDTGNLHGTLYDSSGHMLDVDSLVTGSSGGTFTVYFVPDPGFNGEATFTFAAQDNDGHVDDTPATATITVDPVNDPPVVAHEIPDQSLPPGVAWMFQVPTDTFSDADGDALTYHATLANGDPLPSWLMFNPQNQTFSGAPPPGFTAVLQLTVTASDGQSSAQDTFALSISNGNPNQAPVLTSDPNPPPTLVEDNAAASESGTLVTVTDPGDTVHYDMTGWTPVFQSIPGVGVYDGHFYIVIPSSVTWDEARSVALTAGGHLANITSEGENNFVHSLVGGTSAWIGATDSAQEGTWVWADGPEANQQFWQGAGPEQGGQALGYQHFWGSEPNGGATENYVFIDQGGYWTDASANNATPQSFVIEFSDLADLVDFTDFTYWQRTGAYGTAYFDTATGALAYALDNESDAVQALNSSDHVTESFDIIAVDDSGATGSTTVTFEIDGADEANNPPNTQDAQASGDEDTAIYVSLSGNDDDGHVTGFRITDTSDLNGTLYRDSSQTEILHLGDVVNTSSGGYASVYFVPNAEYSGTAHFNFAAIDNNQEQDPSSAVATIEVWPVNDPVVDLDPNTAGSGYETSIIAGSGDEILISASPSIADPDDVHIQSVTITLIDGEIGDDLITGDNVPGLADLERQFFGEAGNPDNPLGVTFWGDAPISTYELAIGQLQFSTTSLIEGDRHIKVVVSDGTNESYPVTSTVSVVGSMNTMAMAFDVGINETVPTAITGTDGPDVLAGTHLNDIITGFGGDDLLQGGGGANTFVFAFGDGHDTITDFVVGQDKVDLTVGVDQAGLEALLAMSPDSHTLTFSDGSSVTFTGLTLAQLNAQNDFILHSLI